MNAIYVEVRVNVARYQEEMSRDLLRYTAVLLRAYLYCECVNGEWLLSQLAMNRLTTDSDEPS
jgi:hypothetical protein